MNDIQEVKDKKILKQLKVIDSEFQKLFDIMGYEPGNSDPIGESHGWLLDAISDREGENND